ncbi:MAG: glycosyltransferase family 2 protein [Christensenella sp.]|uniref:glycosyltransferase family 2 protein n=1 Tax=Christensenella sp. TaxID=1935934 RepID=UPI002B1F3CD3|nr:glycosyltransferase family 2 protein [Christensenella sp.]MEA5002280.1 glycosyltransferase family 2 protein [Christensenella sp.]
MKKLSIIIPVYYNEQNLEPLYRDLKEKALEKLPCDYEIILVDDGSKDGSYRVMQELKQQDDKIKTVKLARNFGEHAALLAGLNVCTGDCAVRKAADLQEPSEMILEMLEKHEQGNKVVLAVREGREDPAGQKALSNLYTNTVRRFALKNMPEGGLDSFLIDRQIIDLIVNMNENNAPITELILWSGFSSANVYYVRQKREVGTSGWTLSKKIKMTMDSLLGFSYFPIRCILAVGGISFAAALVWGVVLLILALTGSIVEPYIVLAFLLVLVLGIVMTAMGILGEYLWRTFDAARKRPVFIIDETDETKDR